MYMLQCVLTMCFMYMLECVAAAALNRYVPQCPHFPERQ